MSSLPVSASFLTSRIAAVPQLMALGEGRLAQLVVVRGGEAHGVGQDDRRRLVLLLEQRKAGGDVVLGGRRRVISDGDDIAAPAPFLK